MTSIDNPEVATSQACARQVGTQGILSGNGATADAGAEGVVPSSDARRTVAIAALQARSNGLFRSSSPTSQRADARAANANNYFASDIVVQGVCGWLEPSEIIYLSRTSKAHHDRVSSDPISQPRIERAGAIRRVGALFHEAMSIPVATVPDSSRSGDDLVRTLLGMLEGLSSIEDIASTLRQVKGVFDNDQSPLTEAIQNEFKPMCRWVGILCGEPDQAKESLPVERSEVALSRAVSDGLRRVISRGQYDQAQTLLSRYASQLNYHEKFGFYADRVIEELALGHGTRAADYADKAMALALPGQESSDNHFFDRTSFVSFVFDLTGYFRARPRLDGERHLTQLALRASKAAQFDIALAIMSQSSQESMGHLDRLDILGLKRIDQVEKGQPEAAIDGTVETGLTICLQAHPQHNDSLERFCRFITEARLLERSERLIDQMDCPNRKQAARSRLACHAADHDQIEYAEALLDNIKPHGYPRLTKPMDRIAAAKMRAGNREGAQQCFAASVDNTLEHRHLDVRARSLMETAVAQYQCGMVEHARQTLAQATTPSLTFGENDYRYFLDDIKISVLLDRFGFSEDAEEVWNQAQVNIKESQHRYESRRSSYGGMIGLLLDHGKVAEAQLIADSIPDQSTKVIANLLIELRCINKASRQLSQIESGQEVSVPQLAHAEQSIRFSQESTYYDRVILGY